MRRRSHFREFSQEIKSLKCCIKEIFRRLLVVSSYEIPGGDKVFIRFRGCLPTHFLKFP